jgi:hypothetical protein
MCITNNRQAALVNGCPKQFKTVSIPQTCVVKLRRERIGHCGLQRLGLSWSLKRGSNPTGYELDFRGREDLTTTKCERAVEEISQLRSCDRRSKCPLAPGARFAWCCWSMDNCLNRCMRGTWVPSGQGWCE